MKLIRFFIYSLLSIMIVSCSQKDGIIDNGDIIGGDDRMVIALSPAEYLSVAFDGNNELADDDAKNILSEFLVSSSQSRSSGVNLTFEISKSYYLNSDGVESLTRSSSSESDGSVRMVEFKIQSSPSDENKQGGFALIAADKRFPEVLVFVPKGNIENTEECGAGLMLKRAQHVALDHVLTINKYQNELREKTIDKITKFYKKPYSFEKVKDLLFVVKDSNTKVGGVPNPPGTPVVTFEPLIKVEWIQGGPQNQFIKPCAPEHLNKWSEFTYGGRYPAGCTAVAVASVLSYFKPTVYSDSLGKNVDWDTALTYRQINWGSPKDALYVKEAAGVLQAVADGINTTYGIDGGSASMSNASTYMRRLGIMMDNRTEVSYFTIRPSIGRQRPVILTGTARRVKSYTRSETSGSHAWIMDGIKIMQRPSSYSLMSAAPNAEMRQFNNYGHCNFGWAYAFCNGWYLFDSNGYINFDCSEDKYDINLGAYPNIRQ